MSIKNFSFFSRRLCQCLVENWNVQIEIVIVNIIRFYCIVLVKNTAATIPCSMCLDTISARLFMTLGSFFSFSRSSFLDLLFLMVRESELEVLVRTF